MVLKVSVSLRGDTIITLESSEPQVFRDVVALALKELPRDLLRIQMGVETMAEPHGEGKNALPRSAEAQGTGELGNAEASPDANRRLGWGREAEEGFTQFCGSLSPMGDMRRVVVVAEGAHRFLEEERISERELGHLFGLVGWRLPESFVQTLRNAARSKFRWLERVPGTKGYYTITDAGRDNVIGNAAP